jgi:hypothetical protein
MGSWKNWLTAASKCECYESIYYVFVIIMRYRQNIIELTARVPVYIDCVTAYITDD